MEDFERDRGTSRWGVGERQRDDKCTEMLSGGAGGWMEEHGR